MTTAATLRNVIALLWEQLPDHARRQLLPTIEQLGATDAIPAGALAPVWKSTIEVALEFGLSPSTLRTNWPRQYGIRPTGDRWLASDIDKIRLQRHLHRSRRTAANL